ncbi:MAG: glycoside hydrolase family 30 beta sandwich domain-containing protein [Tepidisphaeraceae bacterium]
MNAASVRWVCSTETSPWQTMPVPTLKPNTDDTTPTIRVTASKTYQTIDGFGGCFNELSWDALSTLPDAERDGVLQSLFGDTGCGFMLGRIPIGASDFARNWYSHDETPGDLDLKHFSIARDREALLPYIRAAMTIQPGLRCWGSAWSPPAWMKDNANYSGGSLIQTPEMLQAYANYLVRWTQAYKAEGVNVYALTPQNEPNIVNVYPTCIWTGPQLREFIANHLGPALRDSKTDVELWLGLNGDPPNAGDNANARLLPVMDDSKANEFITGLAFQYDSKRQIALARDLYPTKKLMQSETVCFNGANSWAEAEDLFKSMKRHFDGGAGAYFMWNMALDDVSTSTWNWKQNSMITIDRKTHAVRFNGEYHVMRHFSQFVKPGAKRTLITGPWDDKAAFVNADGSVVLVIGNTSNRSYDVPISVTSAMPEDRNGTIQVTVPAHSINTFVVDR